MGGRRGSGAIAATERTARRLAAQLRQRHCPPPLAIAESVARDRAAPDRGRLSRPPACCAPARRSQSGPPGQEGSARRTRPPTRSGSSGPGRLLGREPEDRDGLVAGDGSPSSAEPDNGWPQTPPTSGSATTETAGSDTGPTSGAEAGSGPAPSGPDSRESRPSRCPATRRLREGPPRSERERTLTGGLRRDRSRGPGDFAECGAAPPITRSRNPTATGRKGRRAESNAHLGLVFTTRRRRASATCPAAARPPNLPVYSCRAPLARATSARTRSTCAWSRHSPTARRCAASAAARMRPSSAHRCTPARRPDASSRRR